MSVLDYITTKTISLHFITALFILNYLKTPKNSKKVHINPMCGLPTPA